MLKQARAFGVGLVLATQNPIEQEGTYPLPEAQLDRFFFKLLVPYSNRNELAEILERTTAGAEPRATAIVKTENIIEGQQLVRKVAIAAHVQDYAIRLTMASHPGGPFALEVTNKYVRWGVSPRAVQTLTLGAKLHALLDGRFNVGFDDVRRAAGDAAAPFHQGLRRLPAAVQRDDTAGEVVVTAVFEALGRHHVARFGGACRQNRRFLHAG